MQPVKIYRSTGGTCVVESILLPQNLPECSHTAVELGGEHHFTDVSGSLRALSLSAAASYVISKESNQRVTAFSTFVTKRPIIPQFCGER